MSSRYPLRIRSIITTTNETDKEMALWRGMLNSATAGPGARGGMSRGVGIEPTSDMDRRPCLKLLVDAGRVCADYMDRAFRNLPCRRIEVGELSSFVYCKEANVTRAKSAPPKLATCGRGHRDLCGHQVDTVMEVSPPSAQEALDSNDLSIVRQRDLRQSTSQCFRGRDFNRPKVSGHKPTGQHMTNRLANVPWKNVLGRIVRVPKKS